MHEPLKNGELINLFRKINEQSLDYLRSGAATCMQLLEKNVSANPILSSSEFSNKAISHVGFNIERGFDVAQELINAKDASEFFRIQADFVQDQVKTMTRQVKELAEAAMKAVPPAALFVPPLLNRE